MVVHPDWGYNELSVKVNVANMQQAIADVETVWNELGYSGTEKSNPQEIDSRQNL